jgi:ATP-dependent Lhr-like helicase
LLRSDAPTPEDAFEQARYNDIAVESAARMLLNRYGVVFRDLLVLESNIPRWGILQRMLRRLEDRGEVRGGRFVSGFGGEQFALPEVLDTLRATSNLDFKGDMTIAGADPVNLIGILVPGERVPAVPGRSFVLTRESLGVSGPLASRHAKRYEPRSTIQQRPPRSNDVQELSLFKFSSNG